MKRNLVLLFTILASGRAMTLAFIGRVGDGGAGDPPDAWLMPLIGDAVIGVSALIVAALIWRRPTPVTWLVALVWSAIGAFDAIAALLVEVSMPWPEFFMLEIFGRSMFVAATALHLGIIVLLGQPDVRASFGVLSTVPGQRAPRPAT